MGSGEPDGPAGLWGVRRDRQGSETVTGPSGALESWTEQRAAESRTGPAGALENRTGTCRAPGDRTGRTGSGAPTGRHGLWGRTGTGMDDLLAAQASRGLSDSASWTDQRERRDILREAPQRVLSGSITGGRSLGSRHLRLSPRAGTGGSFSEQALEGARKPVISAPLGKRFSRRHLGKRVSRRRSG